MWLGADADMVLVDFGATTTITAAHLHYRHPHSPFVGRRVRARIVRTLLRGRTVFADGRFPAPPSGILLTPDPDEEYP